LFEQQTIALIDEYILSESELHIAKDIKKLNSTLKMKQKKENGTLGL
jgi:hypothetical protein